jgi:uncharacterized membrane protein YagU involved in acid resistance
MSKSNLFDNIRLWIGDVGYSLWLWAHGIKIPLHCEHGYNGLCPECDAMNTPPQEPK